MSSPNWWGDWRPTLTPHTGNLLATDLIECTMIVGGLPVNTVITGAQILGAVPSGGGLDIGTSPITSGTVGRILFQGTGNVLQQSANLFWNNTNSRLGIGTASPSYTLQVAGTIKATGGTQAGAIFGAGVELTLGSDAYIQCTSTTGKNAGLTIHRFSTSEYASLDFLNGGSFATGWSIQSRPSSTRLDIVDRNPTDNIRMCFHNGGNIGIGTTTNAGYRLDVNGTARVSGNLTFGSSTSYLYGDTNNIRLYDKNNRIILQCYPSGVLNSETSLTSGTSATSSLRLRDDYASIEFSNTNSSSTVQNPIQFIKGYFGNIGATDKSIVTIKSVSYSNLTNATLLRGLYIDINDTTTYTGFTTFRAIESKKGGAYFNTTSANSSAILQADSTTQGFLPPRMTNAQMLAIATPAAGLVVYDTTNNKHCGYNGTAWQNFY